MDEENLLELFISEIDKIVLSGGALTLSEGEDYDDEYKELLLLAQLLTRIEYPAKGRERLEKILAEKSAHVRKDDELADSELDMVAGGLNLDGMPDKEKGK